MGIIYCLLHQKSLPLQLYNSSGIPPNASQLELIDYDFYNTITIGNTFKEWGQCYKLTSLAVNLENININLENINSTTSVPQFFDHCHCPGAFV